MALAGCSCGGGGTHAANRRGPGHDRGPRAEAALLRPRSERGVGARARAARRLAPVEWVEPRGRAEHLRSRPDATARERAGRLRADFVSGGFVSGDARARRAGPAERSPARRAGCGEAARWLLGERAQRDVDRERLRFACGEAALQVRRKLRARTRVRRCGRDSPKVQMHPNSGKIRSGHEVTRPWRQPRGGATFSQASVHSQRRLT